MTRKELIKAIYDSTDMWACPDHPCDFPEEEGNTGECCWKCAEKQLAEHEAKIRANVIKEYMTMAMVDFFNFDAEHGYPTHEDVKDILVGVANKLKEQKRQDKGD